MVLPLKLTILWLDRNPLPMMCAVVSLETLTCLLQPPVMKTRFASGHYRHEDSSLSPRHLLISLNSVYLGKITSLDFCWLPLCFFMITVVTWAWVCKHENDCMFQVMPVWMFRLMFVHIYEWFSVIPPESTRLFLMSDNN